MKKTLPVESLRIDADTQNRLKINEEVVEDYTQLIVESNGEWPLGDLDVFHDGSEYFVADGFHRTLGAERAKRAEVPCRVHKGTATDARIFGMTANDRHGLRMSRADKRACVEWLLDNGGKLTQAEVAEKAGVSKRLVQMIVAERKPPQKDKKAQIAPFGASGGDGFIADCTHKVQQGMDAGPRGGGFKLPEMEIELLSRLQATNQDNIAEDLRKGKAKNVKDAMAKRKIKMPPIMCCSAALRKAYDEERVKIPKGQLSDLVALSDEKRKEAEAAILDGTDPAHAINPRGPKLKTLSPEEKALAEAKKQIGIWHTAVGKWFVTIDSYRTKYPGKAGDNVLKKGKELYLALGAWEKGIK